MRQKLRKILAQLFRFRKHIVFFLPCSELPLPELVAEETITVLSKHDVDGYPALCRELIELNPENADYLDDVSNDKMHLVVFCVANEIVHYGYLMKSNRTICLLGLPVGAALLGNAYTVPAYRGKGCQGRSVLVRARLAKQAGFEAVYSETSPDNVASQRGLRKAGMCELGHINYALVVRFIVIRSTRPKNFSLLGFCR